MTKLLGFIDYYLLSSSNRKREMIKMRALPKRLIVKFLCAFSFGLSKKLRERN
jgi:hypothetical protein